MSTATFLPTNPAFVYSPGASSNSIDNGRLDFDVTGARLELTLNAFSNQTVRVTYSDADGSNSNFTDINVISSGMAGTYTVYDSADKARRVSLRGKALPGSPLATVTGTTPSISAPAVFGTPYSLDSPQVQPHVQWEGFVSGTAIGSGPPFFNSNADGVLRIRTDATSLLIWAYGQSQKVRVKLDSAAFGAIQSPTFSGSYDYFSLNTGITDGQFHDVEVRQVDISSGNDGPFRLYGLNTVGGTLDLTKAWTAKASSWLFVGDSLTQSNTPSGRSPDGWAYKLGAYFGIQVFNAGYAGTGIPFSSPINVPAGVAPPAKTFVWLGHNNGTFDQAYQDGYQSLINTILAAYPDTKIYVLGLSIPSGGSSAADARMHTVFDALPSANKGQFIAPSTEIYPSFVAGDNTGLHYLAGGYDKMVAYLEPIVAPDTTAPTVTSKTVNASGSVSLALSEPVTAAGSPSNYALVVAGTSRTVTAVTLTDSTHITLTPSPVVYQGLTGVTVAYSGTAVKDAANNALATFTAQSVTNNSTVPAPDTTAPTATLTITANGDRIRATFSEAMNASSLSGFTFLCNGAFVGYGLVSDVDDDGLVWEFVRSSGVFYSTDAVTAYYLEEVGNFADLAGNGLAGFAGVVVEGSEVVREGGDGLVPIFFTIRDFGLGKAGHDVTFILPHTEGMLFVENGEVVGGTQKPVTTGEDGKASARWFGGGRCLVDVRFSDEKTQEKSVEFTVPVDGGDVGALLGGG